MPIDLSFFLKDNTVSGYRKRKGLPEDLTQCHFSTENKDCLRI